MNKNDHVLRAEALIKQGEFPEAIAILSRMIANEPKSTLNSYLKLAEALELDGRLDESLAIYENILKIKSTHLLAKSKVAKIKFKQEKISEAMAAYEEAMAIANPNPPLWLCNDWQKALRKTGNIDKAIAYYKKAIRLQPDNFIIRIQLASIYKKEGRNCLPAPFVQKQFFQNHSNPLSIFDIGANVGDVAQEYSSMFPDAKIYCFEPTPQIFQQLEQNIAKNNLKNVEPHRLAVSNERATAKFYLHSSENNTGLLNSLLPGESDGNVLLRDSAFIEVPTTTIDLFCEQQNITSIDILKFDIQGGEFLALNGAKRMLENKAIGLIYTEVHFGKPIYDKQAMFTDIGKLLQDYGFFLYDIYPRHSYFLGNLTWGDAIFIGPSLIEEFESQGIWR